MPQAKNFNYEFEREIKTIKAKMFSFSVNLNHDQKVCEEIMENTVK